MEVRFSDGDEIERNGKSIRISMVIKLIPLLKGATLCLNSCANNHPVNKTIRE